MTSEIDKKFKRLGMFGKVDSKVANIIEDESEEAVIVKG